MSLRKGDRVCCKHNENIIHGVVSKGGKKTIEMIVDGAKEKIKGSYTLFTLSDKPLSKSPPSVMDKWTIKGYKEIDGHGDTPTFSANICLNGKPVIHAGNNGWGGPNEYHTLKNIKQEVETQFYNDTKEWGKKFECKYNFEVDELWIEWMVFYAPYGVTAKEYLSR